MSGRPGEGKLTESAPTEIQASQPLRMLSLCETANGGVGRYQENLLALCAHGIATRVLLPESDKHILSSDADMVTYRRKRRDIASLIRLLRAFLTQRNQFKPDIYFFNSTFALVPLLVLRLLRDKTPAIYCAHCWAIATIDPDGWKGRVYRAIEGTFCGLADLVVNVSEHEAATAKRFGYRGRHVVVVQAVRAPDPDARSDLFARQADDDVHLLFVGRFDRQKGLDILLPAFARARALNRHLHLHLVGGAVRDVDTPHLGDGVTSHGWAGPDEIDSLYRSADALIVPSRWEAGMPLVVLEALRNGTPVFASTGCGMGDFLARNECGARFDIDGESLEDLLAGLTLTGLARMRPRALNVYFDQKFTIARFTEDMAGHVRDLTQGHTHG
ncbi:glycosyltransferase family 4 protein [Roseovarius sp. MBR-154]